MHGIIVYLIFVDASNVIAPLTTMLLPIVLPLAALAITMITPVTYLLIERPAIRLGSRLAKMWTGRRLRISSLELEVAL